MKIGDLLNAREATSALYRAKVNGKTAIQVRRAVRQIEQELSDYDEARKKWIESEGLEGKQISELTDEQRQYMQELFNAEVDPSWKAPVSIDDLEGVEVSAAELDALISVGLVRDDIDLADGPPMNAETVPA
ncbi:MAG: hypothetical protein WD492_12975 [Alkalispirochaeta sp.]